MKISRRNPEHDTEDVEPPLEYDDSDSCPDKDAGRYRMDYPRRGVAAIFNQEFFDKSSKTTFNQRKGSEKDCASLTRSYTRLGFDVEVFVDLTLAEIECILQELSKRDHSDCDCFLLTFMTHGLEGKLRARDQIFDINLLWDSFTAERCPSLANKPKIFIIQACQGHGRQGCTSVMMDEKSSDEEYVKLVPSYLLPLRADFLVALSTIPGFVSWRSPLSGSWYIQMLCRHLDKHGFNQDILTILTNVNRGVALDHTYRDPITGTCKKQLPSFISMLIRQLRFTKKTRRRTGSQKRMQALSESDEETDIEQSVSLMSRLTNDRKRKRSYCCQTFHSGHPITKRKRRRFD